MKVKQMLLILTVAALPVISCKKDLTGIYVGQEFTLSYHQTAILTNKTTGENLRVKFEELVDDTRCPKGANCFVAGKVTIELLVNKKEKLTISPINVFNKMPIPGQPTPTDTTGIVNYSTYKILLLDVNPAPELNKKISKGSYSAKLKVIK